MLGSSATDRNWGLLVDVKLDMDQQSPGSQEDQPCPGAHQEQHHPGHPATAPYLKGRGSVVFGSVN